MSDRLSKISILFGIIVSGVLVWQDLERYYALGEIQDVAFSQDGSFLAAAHRNGRVSLWNPTTGKRTAVFRSDSWTLEAVAVSHDNRWIASFQRMGNEEGRVRIWDAASGREIDCIQDCYPHSPIAFHPNRPVLAWETADHSIGLWDASARMEIRRLAARRGWASALEFSPDGRHLVLGLIELKGEDSLKNAVVLWDVEADRLVSDFKGLPGFAWDVAISPKGDRVAAVAGDSLRVWDTVTREIIRVVDELSFNSSSVTLSRDGARVTAGMGDGTVQEFDILDGRLIGEWKKAEDAKGSFRIAQYDPQGRFLATSERNQVIFRPLTP